MGKKVVFVPECHSTNALAHELSQNTQIIEGTIIITDHQTAGRGQRGNTWDAEPGKNLTFSVVLKPRFLSLKDQFFLNIFTSLAIHDVLRDKINATGNIKWPNDILINTRKLCGILVENQIQGEQVSNSVIGIGLNVNQRNFKISTATSLAIEANAEFDLQGLFIELVESLERRYLQLRENHHALLKREYLEQLFRRNEQRLFFSNGTSFEGIITGVDEAGRLLVRTPAGERSFNTQEIKYVD
jgi:BirA family transcriptional regulator, biotin operon repressor / biotin---[acetyl-CoA-carboxylase] ligase